MSDMPPEAEPVSIERLIADNFQDPRIYSIQEVATHLLKLQFDHGGKQPAYITGSYAQVRRWERDMLMFDREPWSEKRLMTIMNVRVIERPGPATVIWSESLA
jgi:hypothetical protein